jgi:glycosyltransferase involved in cell wall biosynthesis
VAERLRVVLDARMPDAIAGGVQQFVIGLASALARLPIGEEDYRYLVTPEHRWLDPHVDPGQYLAMRAPDTAGDAPEPWQRGMRRWLGDRVPGARAAWRRTGWSRPNRGRLPASDGVIEAAQARVMHFTFQGAFLTDVPSIYQPWDLQHEHLPGFFTLDQLEWRRRAYPAFARQARVVVVASRWARQDMVDRLGIPADKVAVVNVPPATAAYPDPSDGELEAIRSLLNLPAEFLYYPAQTWPHKNHARLFAALSQLRKERGLPINLVCSGGPNDNDAAVRAEAERLGLDQVVRFVGFVAPVQVRALYRLCRALVFPSMFEGWGFPVLEAFQLGAPVLCSDVTSLSELVGDAAIVVDPSDVDALADGIDRIWTDPELRSMLVERGHRVVAGLDWETTARSYRALYRMVAGRPLAGDDTALLDRSFGAGDR